MTDGTNGRRARRLSLGGLLLSIGLLGIAFVPGTWGVAGAVVFGLEIALVVVGAGLIWWGRRG